ncbi:MAG: DUF2851 family protein [Bacteroidales bacterium]
MTEEFIHHIWKYALYKPDGLKLTSGEPIDVIKPGEHNHNAGPDFLNARLKIGETLWAGDIEIHINSSDWEKHRHHENKAYNSVILQIVCHDDKACLLENGSRVPATELQFDPQLYRHYLYLIQSRKWIACKDEITLVDPFVFYYQLEMLTIERLHAKSEAILNTFQQTKNDWSETFYIHLARNFGFKVNSGPFEMLARSLQLKYIAKHKNNLLQVEALLFGQAGFLNDEINDEYFNLLSREYKVLQAKFRLKPLEKHIWKFLRLRPDNFPTIRISQFASLLEQSSQLFATITETPDIKTIQKYFNVSAAEYWKSHYRFGAISTTKKKKSFGTESINNLIINTIAPFLFVFGNHSGKEELKDRALNFLMKTSPEDNTVIRNWVKLGYAPKNAFESQGMLQLKNNYCDKKRCLSCNVGNKIIASYGRQS